MSRTPSRPSRGGRTRLYLSAVAVVVAVGGVYAALPTLEASSRDVSSAPSSSASAVAGTSRTQSVAATTEEPAVDYDAVLAEAMKTVVPGDDARVSVAVLDVRSGESATYGDGEFDTASIVKVDILAALLLRAQDDGRALTTQEKSYATTMIENSSNASATALWDAIGGADGLDAANQRLGLTGTTGGDGELWGLTQTTAADQLTLLRAVFGSGSGSASVLDASSRTYIKGLMGQVEADQQWGVSAAGSSWELKNGWLPRSATGLWDINSIGHVTAGGRSYLLAVLSGGNSSQKAGISLVEDAARTAVTAIAGAV
ncbi:serine hydrolase [Streptomyces sp. NBC_01465]|uniref:serine hydrolase n=1 Tax=Streptomyces sp. NBC_01465 TaxID=2903878 RepID=UPI002E326E52|nr:serine hydrolase [Streptomyces sp. NBC_01465]